MQARPPRFEIQKPLEYRVQAAGGDIVGAGRTINISRRGVLFETADDINVGKKIERLVDMGDAVGSGSGIRLRLHGITVRSEGGAVAVCIKKYRLKSDGEDNPNLAAALKVGMA